MPERIDQNKRSAVLTDLGTTQYQRALHIQLDFLHLKLEGPADPKDRIILVEHPPVFTLGKRGGKENLTVNQAFLSSKEIEVIQTDRGGNITFHGPGQAVLYPIIDLEKAKLGVKDFVTGLEEVMKQTVMDFGISAERDTRNPGLWVGDNKIGSVGISVKKGVCSHGIALNVNMDLTPFTWINPCGLENVGMTSIKKEMDRSGMNGVDDLTMAKAKQRLVHHFSTVFDYTINADDQ